MAGLSQEELALESDLDRTYVSMIERSKKIPTISTLVKLSGPLNQTPAQLLARAQQLETNEISKPKRDSNKLMFFGTSVSCGKPISEDFSIDKELSLEQLLIKRPADTFFIRASGDSMSPTIWDQDILIVSMDLKLKNGSIVLAQVNDDYTIKRYFKTSKGIKLIPDNQSFKEILVTPEMKFQVCGVITGTTRVFQ